MNCSFVVLSELYFRNECHGSKYKVFPRYTELIHKELPPLWNQQMNSGTIVQNSLAFFKMIRNQEVSLTNTADIRVESEVYSFRSEEKFTVSLEFASVLLVGIDLSVDFQFSIVSFRIIGIFLLFN